jgi:hypothetical protein
LFLVSFIDGFFSESSFFFSYSSIGGFRMKLGKWVLGIAALGLILGGVAEAQTFNANSLCLNGGSGYQYTGPFWGYPNHGAAKYFPSFAHIPSTSVNQAGFVFPWKLAGWGWTGTQGNTTGPTWYWETCLQSSADNPYGTAMTFDYPLLFCNGTLSHSGFCAPIYGGQVPSSVPVVGTNNYQFPSSMGGWDAYLNVFAVAGASWMIPSTAPNTAYDFGLFFGAGCASAITLPSSDSIWEFVWCMKGPYGQYMVFSCEGDCNGPAWWAGQKGRNYTIGMDGDNGYYWYWTNGCTGTGEEMDMCLFVCDAITIPVNIPGAYWGQPFTGYGFDVGIATLTPYLSSGALQLGFMSEDYTGNGGSRVVLASFGLMAGPPYGKQNNRVPHGWDVLTDLYVNNLAPIFMHTPAFGYPGSMFGTTCGAHSTFLPFPPEPSLMCAEIVYSSYPLGAIPNYSPPLSAGFRVTYF